MEEKRVDLVHQPIEEVIKITGGLGRWQFFFICLTSWSCLVAATNHMSILFLGASPDFQCAQNLITNNSNQCIDENGNKCTDYIFDTNDFESTLVTKWSLVCDLVFMVPLIQVCT